MRTNASRAVQTRPLSDVLATLQQVADWRQVGLLLSDTGAGRTTLLRQFTAFVTGRSGRAEAVLYRAEVVNTPLSLLRFLASSFGLPIRRRRTRDLFEDVGIALRMQTTNLLVVDDAERLTALTLDTLRALRERTGVGILLGGGGRLTQQISQRCPALAHHVPWVHSLDGASLDDACQVVQTNPALSRSRRNYGDWLALSRTLVEASGGNVRRMVQLLGEAQRRARAGHRPINPQLLRRVADEMPGHTVDLADTCR